jgi:hypothetical protein
MSEEQKTLVEEGQPVSLVSGEPVELPKRRAAERPIRTGQASKRSSQLFTVRMWPEPLDGGEVEWRGKVDHVATGEGYAFRDWSRLIVCLEKMLQGGWREGFGVG